MKTLAIIVPIYNEAANLPHLLARLDETAAGVEAAFPVKVSYIFVDDGSADDSFTLLAAHDFAGRGTRLLKLSRNFGKEAALSAGIDAAADMNSDAAVLMDADLQHPPEMVPEFVRLWLTKGADSVYAYKSNRHSSEGWLKAGLSKLFYWTINRQARYHIPADAGDFRLVSRRFMNALRALPESERFMKGLYGWIGFDQIGIPYTPAPRLHGTSSFNPIRLLSLTLDGLASFTTAPLRLMALSGLLVTFLSMIYGVYVVVQHLLFPAVPTGIASVLTLVAFFGGIQIAFLGLLGEYVGKSMLEAKKRPTYILAETVERQSLKNLDKAVAVVADCG